MYSNSWLNIYRSVDRDNCFRGNMIHPINFIELKLDIIVPVQSEFYSPLYNNQFNVSSWVTYLWGEVRLNWCEYGQFIELRRFRGERSFWWRQSWRWRFQVEPGRRRHPYKSFIPQGSQHWHGLEVKKNFRTLKTNEFSTDTQSRFPSVTPDGVLGPLLLACHNGGVFDSL